MATHVTVGAVTPRIQYVADGYQTDFPFPFVVFKEGDLQVYLGDILQSGGYTVAGAGSSDGGTVTFAAPPGNGMRVTLRRKLTIARLSDFQEGGAFRAKVINDELDVLTAALQELETELGRALTLSPTAASPATVELPPAVPGKAIGWSDDGLALVNDPTDFANTVQTVQQWATDAEGSVQATQDAAAAAEVHADQAAVSAAAAAADAETAGTRAAAADASATAAAVSAAASLGAQREAEAFASAAAFAGWILTADRDAAIAAASAAAASADAAETRAAEALVRLEDTDVALWRAERAARRAEAAAPASLPSAGTAPGAVLPNWARIDT